MERLSILLALFAIGCGAKASNQPPPATPPPAATTAEPPPTTSMRGEDGPPPGTTPAPSGPVDVNTKETPVLRCGPMESYKFVAGEFKCQDGSNPFGGDPALGQKARLGNVGANSHGHIIDVYEVPCPEGPRRVFVDMYGCNSPPGGGGGGSKI